ncbi:hypothetical protein BC835DRAFT_1416561 [Cytidiella melzeri]|nr:hypothetical protein BC835DRAFT_1416561 [Cytidiella melzeri]
MSSTKSGMTLRSTSSSKKGTRASDSVEILDGSPTRPPKKQRQTTQKAASRALPKATPSRSSRPRAKGAASSPSKLAKTTSSLTTLQSESTIEQIAPSVANPPPSQNPQTTSRDQALLLQNLPRTATHSTDTVDAHKDRRSLKRKRDRSETSIESDVAAKLDLIYKREKELAERIAAKAEEEKSLAAITLGQRAAEALKTMEESYSCSLCFEVMACPYFLTPSQCGHTFCAMCLLQWFFTHLHQDCGSWHEILECPLCRSLLPETPPKQPRQKSSCPFAPNRFADEIISSHVKSLANMLEPPNNAPEHASPTGGKGKERAQQGEASSSFEPLFLDGGEDALNWKSDGSARKAWNGRDQLGREKMNFLISRWQDMGTRDLLQFKRGLGL